MLVRAGLIAGVILFGGYATQTIGLQYTSPSTSAFLTGLYVIITPVIESAISRRLPRPPVIVGIVVATFGLYLLTGADVHLGRGEVFTLACAVLFAWHIVYIGAYTHLLSPAAVRRAADRRGRDAVGRARGPAGRRVVEHVGGVRGRVHRHRVLRGRAAAAAVGSTAHPRDAAPRSSSCPSRCSPASPGTSTANGSVPGGWLGAVAIMAGIVVSEFWPRRPVPPDDSGA